MIERVLAKNLEATLLFVDFTKAFDSMHKRKMEQMLLAYGLLQKKKCQNTKAMVRSADVFDIVAEVSRGDTFALYLFILCLYYTLRTSIDLMQ